MTIAAPQNVVAAVNNDQVVDLVRATAEIRKQRGASNGTGTDKQRGDNKANHESNKEQVTVSAAAGNDKIAAFPVKARKTNGLCLCLLYVSRSTEVTPTTPSVQAAKPPVCSLSQCNHSSAQTPGTPSAGPTKVVALIERILTITGSHQSPFCKHTTISTKQGPTCQGFIGKHQDPTELYNCTQGDYF